MSIAKKIKTPNGAVWTLGKLLGAGTYGEVYTAMSSSGKKGAVKLFKKSSSVVEWDDEQTMAVLATAECKGVAPKVYSYGINSGTPFIISELMDGSVYNVYPQTLLQLFTLFRDMTYCISVLHGIDPGIAHLDLKPANFLVRNGTNEVKVADFGMACNTIDVDCYEKDTTLIYKDPHLEDIQYGSNASNIREYLPADVFALGVIFREMMYLYVGGYTERSRYFWDHVTVILRNPALPYNSVPTLPKSRRSAQEMIILDHFDDIIRTNMLVDNPKNRVDADNVYDYLSKAVKLLSTTGSTPTGETPKKTLTPKTSKKTPLRSMSKGKGPMVRLPIRDTISSKVGMGTILSQPNGHWNWDILSARDDFAIEDIAKHAYLNWNTSIVKHRLDYNIAAFDQLMDVGEWWDCFKNEGEYYTSGGECISRDEAVSHDMYIDDTNHIAGGSQFALDMMVEYINTPTPKARTKTTTPKARTKTTTPKVRTKTTTPKVKARTTTPKVRTKTTTPKVKARTTTPKVKARTTTPKAKAKARTTTPKAKARTTTPKASSSPIVHIGPKGGRYIIRDGKKMYLKK
jgi:serine/threonine protein kinase